MTAEEALKLMRNPNGEYCCIVPPVMDSTDGTPRIKCIVCGRTVGKVGLQWVVLEWGSKGIEMR